MDFSKYNLVSFGDSFTFGQGTEGDGIDYMEYLSTYPPEQAEKARNNWVNRSLNYSYTNILSSYLGCASTVNLGQMGASNRHTLFYLREFLRTNHQPNNIYLISLTQAQRHISMQSRVARNDKNKQTYLNMQMLRPQFVDQLPHLQSQYSNDFYKLKKGWWELYYTRFKTSEDILYDYIDTYYAITDLLRDKKYFIFDVMNDTNGVIQNLELPRVEVDNMRFMDIKNERLIKSDLSPIETDFLSIYKEHVKNNENYLNIFYLNENYKSKLGAKGFKNIYDIIFEDKSLICTHDSHWNRRGHKRAAKILEKFIRERS